MNIRKLLESYQESYSFTGTCVNSFDADTMEYTNSSAMSDINDLAWLDDEYVNDANNVITTDIDKLKGYIPPLEKESILVYVKERDFYILYNPNEDIHYFYE